MLVALITISLVASGALLEPARSVGPTSQSVGRQAGKPIPQQAGKPVPQQAGKPVRQHTGKPLPQQDGKRLARRVVRATGIGRPPARMRGTRARLMARRAAEVVAVRNLAGKLGLGRSATVRGFRYLPARLLPDGRIEVTVEYIVRFRRAEPDLPDGGPCRHVRKSENQNAEKSKQDRYVRLDFSTR